MARHNVVGVKGEVIALAFLEQKGYRILEINWRFQHTEVDIIACDGDTIVFAEVKTRSSEKFGVPEAAITARKQKNLASAAEAYLESHQLNAEVRFDVVSITLHEKEHQVFHIRDAFYPFE